MCCPSVFLQITILPLLSPCNPAEVTNNQEGTRSLLLVKEKLLIRLSSTCRFIGRYSNKAEERVGNDLIGECLPPPSGCGFGFWIPRSTGWIFMKKTKCCVSDQETRVAILAEIRISFKRGRNESTDFSEASS